MVEEKGELPWNRIDSVCHEAWPYKVVGLARQGKQHLRPIRLDQSKRHTLRTAASFTSRQHSQMRGGLCHQKFYSFFFLSFFFLYFVSLVSFYYSVLWKDVKRDATSFFLGRGIRSIDTCVLSVLKSRRNHARGPASSLPCVCRPVAFTTSCSWFSPTFFSLFFYPIFFLFHLVNFLLRRPCRYPIHIFPFPTQRANARDITNRYFDVTKGKKVAKSTTKRRWRKNHLAIESAEI